MYLPLRVTVTDLWSQCQPVIEGCGLVHDPGSSRWYPALGKDHNTRVSSFPRCHIRLDQLRLDNFIVHGKFGLLSLGKASIHKTALPSCWWFLFFLCAVFSCFRNPPNSDWNTGSLTCRVRSYACVYTRRGWGTPTASQHNILTRKNSHKFFLCSGRDSNLWSWNPLDLEADALPNEPPRPPSLVSLVS